MNGKQIRRYLMTAAAILVLFGCAGVEPGVAEKKRDTGLAVRVKAALIQVLASDSAPIDVEVEKGVVRLRGYVETEQLKQKAEEIALEVEGVFRVMNDIEVK